jgi:hypothetical protein
MSTVDSNSRVLPVDSSLINPEFIRRLQEQRVLHKREVAFHLAEAEKYGAADEALASMIQAGEKIVAILFPAPTRAADAPDKATNVSGSPSWTEAAMAAAGKAPGPTYNEPPTPHGPEPHGLEPHGLENVMAVDHTGQSGNMWRTRLLGGRT